VAEASSPDGKVQQAEPAGHFPRRVPVPVVRPDLALCKPTGAGLEKDARVVVMLDEGGEGSDVVTKLTDRGVTALVLDAGIDTADLTTTLDEWRNDGPVHGVYWLAALDDEGPLDKMNLTVWREALRRRVKNLYATMQRLFDDAPFLVAATRLGGYLGYDVAGASAPLGGAVSGFVKAYKREQPDALAKVVDFAGGSPTADALIEETLRDPGSVEVGRPGDGLRYSIGLAEVPFGDGTSGMTLDQDTVFLVTGAAGSIVSAITADLAAASGGTFHLLDLTPKPDPGDPDLRLFTTDKDALKSEIAKRLKAGGQRPTPVLIEGELSRYERLAAAIAAIDAVTAAGGTAHYHQVDLTDAKAVSRVFSAVRQTTKRVDVLLHAAGLDISRSLRDKSAKEYDLVFDVKSDGWFNVLKAIGSMPLGATVAFSSVAGRFGNLGQTDYSAANDLLCKISSSLRRTRPGTRAIALDWTAWGGIGMATRGSIPKVMEMAGIEMLDPEVGVAWIRNELTGSDSRGEVVVGGRLGMLTAEFDETGGLDPASVAGTGPMVGTAEAAGIYRGLVVRTTLDPKEQPFLNDHRIDGTAVLPGVMGMEAFAEVARLLVPGWHVAAVENVQFLAPVKFYRDEPRTLTISATLRRDGDDVVAACALEAERLLAGSSEPQRTTHFTGSVRLTAAAPQPEQSERVEQPAETVAREPIYQLYFHGPAYQVVGAAWPLTGGYAARLASDLPDNHVPAGRPTVIGPRLAELCFQTAGLFEAAKRGQLALPRKVRRMRVLRDPSTVDGPLYAVIAEAADGVDCSVRDANGDVVVAVEGYGTTPLAPVPGDIREALRATAPSPT
jgi:NAD(P)-dependent dehydrogenase (short-subunit alcohol dehydrogenase family)